MNMRLQFCSEVIILADFAGGGARATCVWEPFDCAQGKLRSLPALIKATLRKQRGLFRSRCQAHPQELPG
jgi:hypothetical protein